MSQICLDNQNVTDALNSIRNLEDKEFNQELELIQKDLKSYVERVFNLNQMQIRIFSRTGSSWWAEKGELLAFALKYGYNVKIEPNPQGKCNWEIELSVKVSNK